MPLNDAITRCSEPCMQTIYEKLNRKLDVFKSVSFPQTIGPLNNDEKTNKPARSLHDAQEML